jgi:thiol:disulfide interchange protein
MIRPGYLLSLFLFVTLACSGVSSSVIITATSTEKVAVEVSTRESVDLPNLQNSALVDFYDPARNPAADLEQAVVIAKSENKRIMLELGGDWCKWCKFMDEFYETHSDILQFRADHYVLVKVNVGPENMNEEFLSQFPAAAGYPHIYILENDGTFVHSQDTAELEDGAVSYVPEVFMAFLQKWAPAK